MQERGKPCWLSPFKISGLLRSISVPIVHGTGAAGKAARYRERPAAYLRAGYRHRTRADHLAFQFRGAAGHHGGTRGRRGCARGRFWCRRFFRNLRCGGCFFRSRSGARSRSSARSTRSRNGTRGGQNDWSGRPGRHVVDGRPASRPAGRHTGGNRRLDTGRHVLGTALGAGDSGEQQHTCYQKHHRLVHRQTLLS